MHVEYKNLSKYPGYRAGADGSIWSNLKCVGSHWYNDRQYIPSNEWKKLKPGQLKDGRNVYNLRREDGLLETRYGGCLVLEAFIGNCPDGLECCHGDGNAANDALYNIRWDTRQSNAEDRRKHGTMLIGESHPNTILSNDDIIEIRSRRKAGETQISIAEDYGVSREHIRDITNGRYR